MTWRQTMAAFLKSGKAISTAFGLTGTGVYVSYTDWTRYRRMIIKYTTGNILPPMAENTHETVYFPRPKLEQVNKTAVVLRSNYKVQYCFNKEN